MKHALFIFIAFLPLALSADPVQVNPRPRSMMMGNTGLALNGDKDSVGMNPAALTEVEKVDIQTFNLLIEAPFEVDTLSSFVDYNDVREDSSSTTAEKRDALETLLSDISSTATAVRINLNPSYTAKNMHFGLFLDAYAEPRLRVNGATANTLVELGGSNGTVGGQIGGGYAFLDNTLEVGATMKPLYRMAVTAEQEQTLLDLIQGKDGSGEDVGEKLFGKDKLSQKAFALGFDLGAKYYIPHVLPFMDLLNPTVGVTYQDIGDTRFLTSDPLPGNIPQSISVGAAVSPKIGIFKNAFALEMRTINEKQEFLNMLHLGAETVIWDLLAIRAGLSQLYWTVGAGVDLPWFEADLFVTAREAGRKAHIQDIRTIGFRISAFAF